MLETTLLEIEVRSWSWAETVNCELLLEVCAANNIIIANTFYEDENLTGKQPSGMSRHAQMNRYQDTALPSWICFCSAGVTP